jgi:hypothetical protein
MPYQGKWSKKGLQMLKDEMIMMWPKTRGLNVEVLLKKGLNNETLGEKGSLRCRNARP